MPRLSEDYEGRDKLRKAAVRCTQPVIRGYPNGSNPIQLKKYGSNRRLTRGTETSKYPEEEKTTVIPQVVASERGEAQTQVLSRQCLGVVGL